MSPRGDVVEHGALRFFHRKGEGVYDFEDLARRRRAMADFVRAHKERLAPGQTVGIGYSNGANILAAVAFEDAGLFDELVLMHPLIPWTPDDNPELARARVLITAGRRDPICPPRSRSRSATISPARARPSNSNGTTADTSFVRARSARSPAGSVRRADETAYSAGAATVLAGRVFGDGAGFGRSEA